MNKVTQAFYEEITGKIINAIQNGTAPWQKCWNGREPHQNAITGRYYSGINQLSLEIASMDIDGGQDPRWLTFFQAKEHGWKIKKGAKGTHVTFWKPFIEKKENEKEAEPEEKIVGVFEKIFTVFHASQIEGINKYTPPEINEIESNERAEKMIINSQARIKFGGSVAFYRPSEDFIQLPQKENFKSTESYYSTLLHELVHWTGHESRLNHGFGDKYTTEYAFEELIAELGSMFIVSSAGIKQTEGEFQNHASYIDSWLKELKRDSKYIFKAAAQANKAATFLLK